MGSSPIPGTPKEKDGNLVAVFFYSLHPYQPRLRELLSLANEPVVVACNYFFLTGWQLIYQTTFSGAISLTFLKTPLTTDKKYVANLVRTVVMGVALGFIT